LFASYRLGDADAGKSNIASRRAGGLRAVATKPRLREHDNKQRREKLGDVD
jgi:hypothetical protein